MTREHVQPTANAHATGGQDGTSHRDAGRRDVQVPSPGTPGIREFLMTVANSRAVHTAPRRRSLRRDAMCTRLSRSYPLRKVLYYVVHT
jgi:hypothetical protein